MERSFKDIRLDRAFDGIDAIRAREGLTNGECIFLMATLLGQSLSGNEPGVLPCPPEARAAAMKVAVSDSPRLIRELAALCRVELL